MSKVETMSKSTQYNLFRALEDILVDSGKSLGIIFATLDIGVCVACCLIHHTGKAMGNPKGSSPVWIPDILHNPVSSVDLIQFH
jgi:hypothetical protein